jgi:hypothetical protein
VRQELASIVKFVFIHFTIRISFAHSITTYQVLEPSNKRPRHRFSEEAIEADEVDDLLRKFGCLAIVVK